ncbi:MAG: hypothetical protein IJS95_02715 [Prevotella sp.]|nr:hypothetical protein [Prevotella sp.]
MKKIFILSAAALVLAGCSKNSDLSNSGNYVDISAEGQIRNEYKTNFNKAFGEPAKNENWGFGASVVRGVTRGALPDTPSFRDDTPTNRPAMPAYSNTVPSDAKYAKDYQNYQKGDVIYINSDYQSLNNPQNTEDLTIYVDGNVTYYGDTNQNGNGTVICVTENSTLKLGKVNTNLTVYLAPNATLDVSEALNWQGQPEKDWQGNPNISLSFQNPHAAIYLNVGSRVLGGNLSFVSGAKVLNAGGTITANSLSLDQSCVLWNEGTITTENNLSLTNTGCTFYNAEGKTVTVKGDLDLNNNNALLYNEGTVNVTGAITTHNTNAEVVNNGTLTASSYSQAAGGKMHNVGTVTITGKTDLTNSNSVWMNEGQYTTGSFDVDNYAHGNLNNCKLTVVKSNIEGQTGKFHLNRGTFVLNSGASVVCDSFDWEDTSDFYLGGNALLQIAGTLHTANANSGYGFRGIGNEYGVIKAAAITHDGNEQFRMSYFGNLWIDTDSHFDQWYKDAPNTNQPAYYYESSVKFKHLDDTFSIDIPSSTCNPGYKYGSAVPSLRVMGEDLSATDASDFDFNDVVIEVQYVSASEVTITLLAAGGTLPLRICQNNNWEVHKLFNVPTTCMVNTVTSDTKYHKPSAPYTWTAYEAPVELSYTGFNGWSTDQTTFNTQVKEKIILEVEKTTTNSEGEEVTDWYELTAPVGQAPSKIAVPTSYHHADWYEHADLTDGLRWAWEKQTVDANALMDDAWGSNEE